MTAPFADRHLGLNPPIRRPAPSLGGVYTVEAIRRRGPSRVFGMQWHPEFLSLKSLDPKQLDGAPVLGGFLHAARERRSD